MKYIKLLSLLAALLMLAAACSSDDAAEAADTTEAAAEDTTPETTEAAEESSEEEPESDEPATVSAIISLSPAATEMLYAIGAEDQILAVDDLSNYPAESADKMQGISAFEPNVESIAALEPDLVITDGTNPDFLAQLDSLGIAHWEGPAAAGFDDIYTQIEQLGVATGHVAEAAELVSSMSARVDAAVESVPDSAETLTYYHELDPTFYSVSPNTFIGSIYTAAGLESIVADDADLYPQLSQEFIVDADPDLIFLACTIYCGETADSVAARDGWAGMSAVVNGNVIEMNDDIASRWGPRSVDYLEQVVAAVNELAAVGAN